MTDCRIPELPPIILPLPDGIQRPKWSVMIPAYNCTSYLKECLESVLAQDPGLAIMQIEVVDDCSTDGDVYQLVSELGKGRVGYFRQEKNRGSLRNFETCINRAKGEWIHILHGDDKVEDGFYREVDYLFKQFPEAGAAFTGHYIIDDIANNVYASGAILKERGIIKDWLHKIAQGNQLQPPAVVVKRSVYEQLGSFFGVCYGEDWEMWVRIAAHYPVAYSPEHLSCYRIHTTNITSHSFLTGQNVRDLYKVLDIIQYYLPDAEKDYLINQAKKNISKYLAFTAHTILLNYKSPKRALMQAHAALRMHMNRDTLYWVLKLYIRYLTGTGLKGEKI